MNNFAHCWACVINLYLLINIIDSQYIRMTRVLEQNFELIGICQYCIYIDEYWIFKGIFHAIIKMLSLITHPHIVPIKSSFFVFFAHKKYSCSFVNYGWTTDVTWTILIMSLLRFCALTVVGPLLLMKGQKALGFHQKYFNFCPEDEQQQSYRFGTTWGWVINDRIFIFRGTIPLVVHAQSYIATFT